MCDVTETVRIRPATAADADLLFAWRNRPEIVELGSMRRPVTEDEHRRWFVRTLESDIRKLFIVEWGLHPVGQIRFDRVSSDAAEVSIYLVAPHTGRGAGRKALLEAMHRICSEWRIHLVYAWVNEDNARSRSFFEKLGFVESSRSRVASAGQLQYGYRYETLTPVSHNRLTYTTEDADAVSDAILASHWMDGRVVARLEAELAQSFDVRDCVALQSGTMALELALRACGVGPGDQVVVPAYACVAIPNAVLAAGARPVWVDIRDDDWNIDPDAALDAVTPDTRAIIAVNTFGQPAAIEALLAAGIPVIEDGAHGFRQTDDGSLRPESRIAVTSLYATKLLSAVQGGAVLTRDQNIASVVRDLRDQEDKPLSSVHRSGRLSDVHAAVGRVQHARLRDVLVARRKLAQIYDSRLRAVLPAHRLPATGTHRVWYRYVVSIAGDQIDSVIAALNQRGVSAVKPVEPWTTELEHCPVAVSAFNSLLSLPLYPTLTERQVHYVCDVLIDILSTG